MRVAASVLVSLFCCRVSAPLLLLAVRVLSPSFVLALSIVLMYSVNLIRFYARLGRRRGHLQNFFSTEMATSMSTAAPAAIVVAAKSQLLKLTRVDGETRWIFADAAPKKPKPQKPPPDAKPKMDFEHDAAYGECVCWHVAMEREGRFSEISRVAASCRHAASCAQRLAKIPRDAPRQHCRRLRHLAHRAADD